MKKINQVGYLYENTYRVSLHTHDYWEVVYYTKGHGFVEINNEVIDFCEHDVFVIPPGIPHTDYSDTGFQNYNYTFTDDNFNHLTYMKLHDTENNDVLTIMAQLYHEYIIKRKNYQNILDALHVVLYHYIHTLIDENDSNRFVTMVINEIINNISNPYYKIQDTLKKVNLTPDYFRKLFFDETGKTPLQYLTHKRISYAKDLLRLQAHSGLSIHEISWNAGFSDNYYFSRVFKKYTGLSPKGWLRRESEKKKTEE